jgi:mannose-6-phosphate isomerase-like protein (cupin superfamily)
LKYQLVKNKKISGDGFVIPKNTRVRIFNPGVGELILIEVLRPAYKKELVQEFKNFN